MRGNDQKQEFWNIFNQHIFLLLFKLNLTLNRYSGCGGGSARWHPPNLVALTPWRLTLRPIFKATEAGHRRFSHSLEPLGNLTVYNFTYFFSTLLTTSRKMWLLLKILSVSIKAYYRIPLFISISGQLKNILLTVSLSQMPDVFFFLLFLFAFWLFFFLSFLPFYRRSSPSCWCSPLLSSSADFLPWSPCIFESEEETGLPVGNRSFSLTQVVFLLQISLPSTPLFLQTSSK